MQLQLPFGLSDWPTRNAADPIETITEALRDMRAADILDALWEGHQRQAYAELDAVLRKIGGIVLDSTPVRWQEAA